MSARASIIKKPPKFIISGAPASGKGTQCEFIKKEWNVVHLSTGDMLRAAAEAETPVGLEAKSYMDQGKLVPDETIIGVVLDRLSQDDCRERGWLLDGFPRTRAQADALAKAGIECDVFIQLDVDDSLLVERVVGRRMDPMTGKIYHLKYSPPPADDEDLISRLVHRSDDTEEKVVVRIQSYKKNLDSIVDKYSERMIRIDGNVKPVEAWANIKELSFKKLKPLIHVVRSNRYPRKFIISGAPASGKGTQCEFIKKEWNVVHLSTGDMLRAAAEAETPVGLEAKSYMDQGKLVPDETIIGVVLDRLSQDDCRERGWLLDGFPRTRAQADALAKAGIECDVFIQLDVDDSLLVERVVGRRMDPVTGKIYHLKYSPPPADDEDLISRLVHRSDDTEEKVVVRIQSYKKNLDSIIDKYADKMIRIDGNVKPVEAWANIKELSFKKLLPPTGFRASTVVGRNPPKFIISGAPASGKGTQCEFIKKEWNVVHLSTGDMLRAAAEAETPVGLEAKSYMDQGKLVPDETIIGVVLDRLSQDDCRERGWLLDGFPRTRAQADALAKAGIECDVFIQLDVDDSLLVERVVGRRMDPVTGKIYHLKYSPPPADDEDLISRLVHRSDDTEEKVVVRIQSYKKNLDSIVDKYSERMIRIDGNVKPVEAWANIKELCYRRLLPPQQAKHIGRGPPKFIISGAPASGKGTQCEFIKKEWNVVHLSTGDMLRAAAEAETPVGLEAKSYMDQGKLVPDETIIGLVLDRLSQDDCRERGWLLDGFPRTRAQADALAKAGIECDVFIQLDVDDSLLVERVVGRRMDPVTGKIYHLKYSPPPADDEKIVSRLVHRSDDTEEKVVVRIQSYKKNLDSIIDKYADKMIRINGNRNPSLIFAEIRALSERRLKYSVVFVLGGPGSGKGTLCSRIKDEFGYIHLSAGDLLREELKTGSQHAETIRTIILQGGLVPAEITVILLSNAMDAAWSTDKSTKFLVDGFPRNLDNAQAWYDKMSSFAIVDVVLNVECDEETMKTRLMGRAQVSGRSDDNEATIMKRFVTFRNDTEPVMKSLDRLGKVRTINAALPPVAVFKQAKQIIQGIDLIPSYQRTFALILPEAIGNGSSPKIFQRINEAGISVILKKFVTFTKDDVDFFYPQKRKESVQHKIAQHLTSSPSIALILEGTNVIKAWNDLMGPANLDEAKEKAPGSIRGQLGSSNIFNAVYGSENEFRAMVEIDYWFDPVKARAVDLEEKSLFRTFGGLPLEDTYAMIKPYSADVNYDEIMSIIVAHGFQVVSQLHTTMPLSVAQQFYNEHVGRDFYEGLTGYMSSGPIVGLHLRRVGAIAAWRYLIGPTNSDKARIDRPDSIRARYGFDGRRNATHGSDSLASAARELAFFFSIGLFHSPPHGIIAAPPSAIDDIPQTVAVSVSVPKGKSKHASKLRPPPLIRTTDIAKMKEYASAELNPVMTALLRNLIVTRPKEVEDAAINKLTEYKYQKMMTGSVKLEPLQALKNEIELRAELEQMDKDDGSVATENAVGSSLEEDSIAM